MPIKLTRAQMGRATGVDTTVKSARGWARSFAPTWEMVMGHKNGVLSDEEYTERYHQILDQVTVEVWRQLYAYGQATGEATLLCYCRDGKFCHTHLIIAYACQKWPRAFCQ